MADVPALTTSQAIASLDPVAAAGEAIRGYCQWHISPVLQTVLRSRQFPACLPTRKLISVDSIVLNDGTNLDLTMLDWYENGEMYVRQQCQHYWRGVDWLQGASITFTHGFEDTPADVVSVVGSLTKRAVLEAARGLITGPFQIQANGAVSADFTSYEARILEKYRVVPFA